MKEAQSVFITGASSGIGEACARAFAAAGFNLVLAARREDRLQGLARELREAHGIQVDAFSLDVRSRKAIESLISTHPLIFDRVRVLINNAGLAKGKEPIQTENPEDWDVILDTNVKGLLYVTRALLPGFIASGDGHVVNIGSVAGHWTYPGGAVYAASKFAVRALNESMRLDLSGTGVRVTSISPGMVESEFSLVRFGGDAEKAKAVYQGMRPLTPADIAETVLWCVQRPKHVNIQDVVIYPTDQASVTVVKRR